MLLRTIYKNIFGQRVLSGPFQGLQYIAESVGSVHFPKLLGTYERELWPQVEGLIAYAPDALINVGAGEGYYAIGIARRLVNVRVVAFEADARGRNLIGQVAALNKVQARVEIRGTCTPADLAAALRDARRPALVIDAEGAEGELLDPVGVPDLARTAVLVEVHDFIAPLGDLLLRRFAPTHHHQEIWSQPRTARDLPGLIRVMAYTPWRDQAVRAMDEDRPGPMRWFWFEPRSP